MGKLKDALKDAYEKAKKKLTEPQKSKFKGFQPSEGGGSLGSGSGKAKKEAEFALNSEED